METQTPGICLSLPPLFWDYQCSTISRVWTHVLFYAGQELYQLSDLSLSEKFPNHSFLTPDDPVPQCYSWAGLSPQLQKLFCFTQKKVPGTQRMGGGSKLQAPAKAALETIELPVQEQEKVWAIKRTLKPPSATGSRPLKARCQGHEFSKCQACDHDTVCLLCQQSRLHICVCICRACLLAALLCLVKRWLCVFWWLFSNMIYLTLAMKKNL